MKLVLRHVIDWETCKFDVQVRNDVNSAVHKMVRVKVEWVVVLKEHSINVMGMSSLK